jgi:hypothetical protein
MFAGWLKMHETCSACNFPFGRGPGYFLGSIYINYGLTAFISTVAYLGLFLGAGIDPDRLLWWVLAFCVLFPLWFFRYARSVWVGFDQYFDPVEEPAAEPAATAPPSEGSHASR